jgi:protein-tyrosine phosphatase
MSTPLFWIQGPWKGRLAVSSRPRGGDWLEDELSSWKREGIQVLVSLLTREENEELELTPEPRLSAELGLEFHAFPIPDRGVPGASDLGAEPFKPLLEALAGGRSVLVHCRQGIGRSGLVAACLLGLSGSTAKASTDAVSTARGVKVPETPEQRQWIDAFLSRQSPARRR